jgi:3-hydroxybutyryl-CoA dehydratase
MGSTGWAAFEEGFVSEWQFSFSQADMAAFGRLSNDHNPLHEDATFAEQKGFKAPVLYGLLLASQISRLIGEELPDKNAMLTGMTMDFVRPAFAGDQLVFRAELTGKSDSTHIVRFRITITRDGKALCRGSAEALWRP